jgi:isocitrate dehydrogenase
VAAPVKAYARANPKKMGAWPKDSKTHVAYMSGGDFYGSEKSHVMSAAGSVDIVHVSKNGDKTVLKQGLKLKDGEVIDSSLLSVKEYRNFIEKQINDAREKDVLFSLHLKATMMKISDPILFGHAVEVFYKDVFTKHQDLFQKLGVNSRNGLGDVYDKIASLPPAQKAEVEADIQAVYASRPRVAMVNSARGITNLHVPSDVIIDASMPCVVRDSGCMWNKDDKLESTKAVIPDRTYARIYETIIEDCKKHGQFDQATMGNVANVGLMAQKAEEYGSHDKTFEVPADGFVRVVDSNGNQIFEHTVEKGDIWRMCQTKDEPIKDWVKLAVTRARATGSPAVFWLDQNRAHDANLIKKVNKYLLEHDTKGLEISIMTPEKAMQFSCDRVRAGKDTISVTGNVLRDYLTDLFPILELGTSAKMLSIVPLLAGGTLFETGAGGSAPKHVQQFVKEGHLRWDSLGEYLAMAVSLEDLGAKSGNQKVTVLGNTLNAAIGELLINRKSPSIKVNELDNRGSSFYIAMYWAKELAKHDAKFSTLASELEKNEKEIVKQLIECQGKPEDIGGYWRPDENKCNASMRPSALFNTILDKE